MLNFINTGLDEATLESVQPYTHDNDLIKAMSKQGLVQREVTVQGSNGTFTRKQWVRASEEQTNPRQSDKQDTDTGSKHSTDLNEFLSGKTLNGKTPKAGIVSVLNSGVSRSELMSAAKSAGVTWKENANDGINWMRASMAIQKHISGASAAPTQTNSQTDSSQDNKPANKDTAQDTPGGSSTVGDNHVNTQNDNEQSTKAAELGVNTTILKNSDMNTLNTMKDSFQAGIVNLIQAKDNARRQAEMAYKSGNDTLRKKCEEMAVTYDNQADKYIAAMTEIVKEIMSRQPKDNTPKEQLPKPTKMTKKEVDKVHTTYMQGDPARDIAYVLLKHPAASIVNNGADVNGNGGSVNRLLEDKAIIQYMNETIPIWQNKVQDDLDNHMKNKKDTKKWQADLQKLVNAKDYVDNFADVWSKWKADNGK